ncbi:ubiquinone anaerobic biosynthesis protein UbiV [Leisingera sp. McT4-56]|uniref:ubiquinone anaerobic biosynthesis protein UbiV n=1 Tax=Leisingera sp. McT4-56 TaxID=2881255 RepID=UPI001CF8AC5C|nr:U32 family peptidase [Leisingera sp. McT4-56]MCB4455716.1 U32 family peptidase [Leisingera sp. McT4-56]
MELTVGPNQFFWPAESWSAFYGALAEAPVDRVVLGELVCSKRLPFYQDRIPEALSLLAEAGKEAVLTSLALVTLKRERKLTADLAAMGVTVEINDLTALAHLPQGMGFHVGPLVNVYNEGTLAWLASLGATRVCLPPELPLASVETLTRAGREMGVAIEVWGHGRLPLAISGRCYHARLHKRTKDNCQFACEDDPDGLEVRTLEDQPFMAMNGVQTLSHSYACADYQIEALAEAGVSALRLSPQSQGFIRLCQAYRDRANGALPPGGIAANVQETSPQTRLSDGFLTGPSGVSWSADPAPS